MPGAGGHVGKVDHAERKVQQAPAANIAELRRYNAAMESVEIAIIGAGPIGIELAVAFKRAGIDYIHLEAGQIGSTIHWYAPGTVFFSSPERIAISGVPIVTPNQGKPTREEYVNYLRGVVGQFQLPIRTYTRVTAIDRSASGGFTLRLQRSYHGVGGPELLEASRRLKPAAQDLAPVRTRKLVLAIGNLHHPRPCGIPGEDLPHVSHYFADPHLYFGRRVLIVGGKNSAVEAAIRLVRVGCDVTLSYRREWFNAKSVKYWLLPELEFFIKKGRMRFLPKTVPVEITVDGVRLAPADAEGRPVAGPTQEVPADAVLLLLGYVQDQTLFEQAGIALEGERRIPKYDSGTMETSVPGVYVAGTAAAGIHEGRALEFIETSHIHVDRIVAALTGRPPPTSERPDTSYLES